MPNNQQLMKKIFYLFEECFTVIYLILYSGGPLSVILSDGANEGEESSGDVQTDYSLIVASFFINYLITGLLLIIRWKKVINVVRKNKLIPTLLAITILSAAWSVNPAKTINRCIAFIGTSLFGVYLASRYTMQEQLKLLTYAFGIATILSFLFVFGMPKYGVMGGVHEGKWRGIYGHKNSLGKIMSPSVIVFLLAAIGAKKKQWVYWLLFLLSLILLVRASSTTSLLNTIVVLFAAFSFRVIRWRDNWMMSGLLALFSVAGCFYTLLSVYSEAFLTSLGKDATLTGRGDMWPFIFEMVWEKPLLGYGYSAFWAGPDTPSFYIWQATGWTPPHSHNGFLDIWVHLGLVGLLIFTFDFLAITLPRTIMWVRLSKTSDGFWPLCYMLCIFVANIGESSLMNQNDLFWVLYIAVAFSVPVIQTSSTNSAYLTSKL